MKRPPQQIIDDAGERQMRSVFESWGWAVRRLEKDNGIDFSVEIFVDFVSTGVIFNVQLKSSTKTPYLSSKEFISQPLKIANARYLCHEVRLPVVLVHADIKTGRSFWCAPQLMFQELDARLRDKTHANVTLRIPTANVLALTVNQLVDTITQIEQVLASRLIISTPSLAFVNSINIHVDQDELARQFQDKGDVIKVNQAHSLFQSKRYAEAMALAERVFNNVESSIPIRFAALLTAENAELFGAMVDQIPQENYATIKLKRATQLRDITRKGPRHLKLFAIIAWEAGKLERLTQRYHGLLLNWVAHREGPNVFWKAQLLFEKTSLYRQILFKYNQCIRLANYSTRLSVRHGLTDALIRIVDAMSRWILNLTSEGLYDLANQFSASTLEICKLAAAIAREDKNEEGLFTAALKALVTKRALSGEAVDFAKALIAEIKHEGTKQKTQSLFDRIITQYQGGAKIEGPLKTSARQVYENMATGIGIDLSDPNSPSTKIFQMGIADLDPSRILVNCEHIFVTFGAEGVLSQLLDMPTAGCKILHCDLHEYAMQGLSLDDTYARFRSRFCDSCENCSRRPSSWKYSDEWQQEENVRHLEYMKRFQQRTGTPIR